MKIEWISIKLLKIADYNPREVRSPEILQSIIETYLSRGLIKPLLVRKTEDGVYEVFDGGTRLEALKIIGVEEAPCIVHECSRLEAMRTTAITHTIREELTPSEKGKFLIRCINEGIWRNVEEAARDLGFSKDTLYCWIREAKADDLIIATRLKKYLDKESKNHLASMPRIVRERIVEEMKNMNEEILLKIKKNIPELFREILEISKDMDVEEVLEYMRRLISRFLEDCENKITRFKTPSGLYYELREEDGKLSISVFEKNVEAGRLQIPLTDLRELIRKLQKHLL